MRNAFGLEEISQLALAKEDGIYAIWQRGITGAGVTVAVLDSGVGGPPTQAVSDSLDLTGGNQPLDRLGHGTQISQLILGYAPNTKIANMKVVDETGSVSRDTLAKGIVECARRFPDIRIANVSLAIRNKLGPFAWCSDRRPCDLCAAAQEAASKGLIIVAAAGNFGQNAAACPGRARGTYTVAALEDAPERLLGRVLRRVFPLFYYAVGPGMTGTSVSAALVSGGLALLVSAFPNVQWRHIRAALKCTATPVTGGPPRLHYYRALKLIRHKELGRSFDPRTALELYMAGRVFGEQTDIQESMRKLLMASQLAPTSYLFHNALGLACLKAGDLERAVQTFGESIRLNWEEADSHAYLGATLEARGDFPEAAEEYKIAAHIDPFHSLALNRLREISPPSA